MSVPTVFDLCTPRADILEGKVTEAEFAADLARVLANDDGAGYADYADPERFFANTYPTRGLKEVLAHVCRRLSGTGGEVAAIFRLDTSYGGGKTHGSSIPRCFRASRCALPHLTANKPILQTDGCWKTACSPKRRGESWRTRSPAGKGSSGSGTATKGTWRRERARFGSCLQTARPSSCSTSCRCI